VVKKVAKNVQTTIFHVTSYYHHRLTGLHWL